MEISGLVTSIVSGLLRDSVACEFLAHRQLSQEVILDRVLYARSNKKKLDVDDYLDMLMPDYDSLWIEGACIAYNTREERPHTYCGSRTNDGSLICCKCSTLPEYTKILDTISEELFDITSYRHKKEARRILYAKLHLKKRSVVYIMIDSDIAVPYMISTLDSSVVAQSLFRLRRSGIVIRQEIIQEKSCYVTVGVDKNLNGKTAPLIIEDLYSLKNSTLIVDVASVNAETLEYVRRIYSMTK